MINTAIKLEPENAIEISMKSIKISPLNVIQRSWRLIFAIVVPIALLPLIIYHESKESRCAYVLLIMALYWMFEPISLFATALIPVALFPLLGILSTGDVCAPYMKSTNMMFVGGLLMAIAIENCNLHKRVALRVLLLVGTSVKRIMLGIMLVTMFLSMWINNTATTAMMVPIVDAMLKELDESPKEDSKEFNNNVENPNESGEEPNDGTKKRNVIRKALLLSIAYSANIGGTGTLTGTGTNLVLQGLFEELYPESSDLTFSHWFIYAAPGMLICVVFAWIFLYILYVRQNNSIFGQSDDKIRNVIEKKYQELGSLTFQEKGVIINFILLVLLWFFRQPEVFPGWTSLISDDDSIKDATPAILIAIGMFLIPANLEQFYLEPQPRKIKTLLDWETVHRKMPWGVVILLGGGFALAEGTQKSGLSHWLGDQLSTFDHLSPRVAMIALTVVAGILTEVASNVATASVLLPVVNQLALNMKVHPLLLMMPVTISVSFAFMFPVATPPNAIVYQSLGLRTFDMIKPGLVMNILCIGIELALINSWGELVFDLKTFPEWAKHPNTTYYL